MELVFIVRDQEDGGSNPLAPTNSFRTDNLQHAKERKTSWCSARRSNGTNPSATNSFHSNQFRERQNANGTDIYIRMNSLWRECSSRRKKEHRINWARMSGHADEVGTKEFRVEQRYITLKTAGWNFCAPHPGCAMAWIQSDNLEDEHVEHPPKKLGFFLSHHDT